MKQKHYTIFILIIFILLISIDPIYAGPGGAIAKGLFKTFWGKMLLGALTIIFLPLIIYIQLKEFFAVKKNQKELLTLERINKDFKWSVLEKNVRNVFERVYIAWDKEKMNEVSSYVSHWYWQNQQLVYLDEWKRKNLRNVSKLKSVGKIKPLHLDITDEENLEGSRIAFSITANVEDYLIHRDTLKVVEGKRGFDDEEKVWILEYTDGKWLLDDIREGNLSLAFAKMQNIIPEQLPKSRATQNI